MASNQERTESKELALTDREFESLEPDICDKSESDVTHKQEFTLSACFSQPQHL